MTQLAANPDRRIDMNPLVIPGRADTTRKSEAASTQNARTHVAPSKSTDSFTTSAKSSAHAGSANSVSSQLAAPSPRIGVSLRASTAKRRSAEPAASREHPPSNARTREQRFKLATEALRAGDRDRAVALLNENAAEKGAVVASLFGLQFVAGAIGHLLPIPTMVAGMSAGFKSCEEADISVALLVAGARAGVKPVPNRRFRKPTPNQRMPARNTVELAPSVAAAFKADANAVIARGGVTAVGRAIQKHSARPGSFFSAGANAKENAKIGSRFIDELLDSSQTQILIKAHPVHGTVLNVRLPNGAGAQFKEGGGFVTILEPYTSRGI